MEIFIGGYKEVAKYYSQIGMIPDDVTTAAEQYRALVRTCIPTKRYFKKLKIEVSQFCNSINKARANYAQYFGRKKSSQN